MGQTLSEPVVEKVCRLSYAVIIIGFSMRSDPSSTEALRNWRLVSNSINRDDDLFKWLIDLPFRIPMMVKTIESPLVSRRCKAGESAWKMLILLY